MAQEQEVHLRRDGRQQKTVNVSILITPRLYELCHEMMEEVGEDSLSAYIREALQERVYADLRNREDEEQIAAMD